MHHRPYGWVFNRAMLHDPIAYPEPDSFTPERWLSTSDGSGSAKSVPIHPMKIALGFGRRYNSTHCGELALIIHVITVFARVDTLHITR